MSLKPRIDDFDQVLVVEGYSDLLFYAEVLEFLNRKVFIQQFNGRDDLWLKLETFITPQLLADKSALAVIVDADSSASTAAATLGRRLTELTRQDIGPHGTWTSGNPKIGFFVTPDGRSNGEIESLVWRAFANEPSNRPITQCVEDYLACADRLGMGSKSPDKGRIGALLSSRFDDDPRLGPGARAQVFDFNRPEFNELRTFLCGFAAAQIEESTPP
jgi:hypothetical protein